MIRYRVAIAEPQRHTALLHLSAPAGPDGLTLHFPAWTPGSYLLREFARYADEPGAEDDLGRTLPLHRDHHASWTIAAPEGSTVHVRWTVWAHELTVRTPHIDDTHAFFTGTNLLPLVAGRTDEPVRLELRGPRGWEVFCPLDVAPSRDGGEDAAWPRADLLGETHAFTAPDYDRLADAIVEVGPHRSTTVEVEGVPHRLVLWEDGAVDIDLERLARETAELVRTNARLFGGLPYPRYDFVFHVTEDGRGGLEHLNSTALAVPWKAFTTDEGRVDMHTLIAHEHLHVWNGKRIRPEALGPFDYLRENHTRALWVVEGLTVYMDELQTLRGGLIDREGYLRLLGQAIRRFETTPGRFGQSLADASLDAWIRLYRPDANSINRTVSYYLKGGLVWLCLDLHLRTATGGERSVDDVLRLLWRRYEEDGQGYADHALPALIREATGVDVADLVHAWVERRDVQPDLDAALGSHGLRIERTRSGAPDLGLVLGTEGADVVVRSIVADGPNAEGALAPGDVLVALDGRRVWPGSLRALLDSLAPGAQLEGHVFRRGVLRALPLFTAEQGCLEEVRVLPVDTPTEEQRALLEGWLGGGSPSR
ncbi:MAG: M61 family peptidase [Deltaproteobacteria bacterium]|nr:MAG: M61 family peptidase [Deltaproteobacteria bacterium]